MIDRNFGEIIFSNKDNIKHLSVRILPDSLQVNLPQGFSQKDAIIFIENNREKILKKQRKLCQNSENELIVSPEKPLQTLTFRVHPIAAERTNVFFLLKNGVLYIEFPKEKDCCAPEMQKIFWNGINYFLRKEAKRILPVRLKQLADLHGFTFHKVTIKSATSRWGSCARSKRNVAQVQFSINLSFYLLLTTQQLVDYVLLHELCHTLEMNHSPHFWREMDKVTDGRSKSLRAELRKYKMPK
ncbi:MAG: M48 family metallopeptidase [Prevotellaceae bacterium]|jgi:predicted metal-dependent hydrolase|nr:M48 family metallopeptidase [Prevotellaceae bacterium]